MRVRSHHVEPVRGGIPTVHGGVHGLTGTRRWTDLQQAAARPFGDNFYGASAKTVAGFWGEAWGARQGVVVLWARISTGPLWE